jgi:hypothetical protein
VGPRTHLDAVQGRKIFPLPGLELRPFGRPARGQSLYRLHCPTVRWEDNIEMDLKEVGRVDSSGCCVAGAAGAQQASVGRA